MARVYLGEASLAPEKMSEALEWSGIAQGIRGVSAVFVKPNLTFPRYLQGVTTSPDMIEAVLQALSDYDKKVYVGESDGGYGSHRVEEAFANFDLTGICRRTGATLVNLSSAETVDVAFHSGRHEITIALPRLLCEAEIHTLTMPVPKVHCMTGISLSLKNQWGCIPDAMRLRHHVHFNKIILDLNKALNLRYSVVDGTFGLDVNGPIVEGTPVPLGWFLASSNPFAADVVSARLIGQKLDRISHYHQAHTLGLVPARNAIVMNTAPDSLADLVTPFRLKRNLWNYVAKTTWYSKSWSHFVYESIAAQTLHRIMYTFRDKPEELNRIG
jgi:uncharacterized protein (DUF362 family)